jgi:hypothetical protein
MVIAFFVIPSFLQLSAPSMRSGILALFLLQKLSLWLVRSNGHWHRRFYCRSHCFVFVRRLVCMFMLRCRCAGGSRFRAVLRLALCGRILTRRRGLIGLWPRTMLMLRLGRMLVLVFHGFLARRFRAVLMLALCVRILPWRYGLIGLWPRTMLMLWLGRMLGLVFHGFLARRFRAVLMLAPCDRILTWRRGLIGLWPCAMLMLWLRYAALGGFGVVLVLLNLLVSVLVMFFMRHGMRRRPGPELGVPHLAAGMAYPPGKPEGHKCHRKRGVRECARAFWPFQNDYHRGHGNDCGQVEPIDECLGARHVQVKPLLCVRFGHGVDAVIRALTEFEDRIRGPASNSNDD